MRTISVETTDVQGIDDLDGQIVDGVEALRQRIVQAIRFRVSTWVLNRRRGLNYQLLIGHQTNPALAASVLSDLIRTEGGAEIVELRDVRFSHDSGNRVFRYSARVETIYGPLSMVGTVDA